MKVFVLLLGLVASGNTIAQVKTKLTNQRKAEMLINDFMENNLNDFKSYEPVEYSAIDSFVSDFFCTEIGLIYIHLTGRSISYYEHSDEELAMVGNYGIQRQRSLILSKEILEKSKNHRDSFPKINIGWLINHKCRTKNNIGVLKLGDWQFGFDESIQNIIFIHSDFSEGKKNIPTDYLLKYDTLKNSIYNIQNEIIKYSNELDEIKEDLLM